MTLHLAKPFYSLAVLAALFLSVASVAAQSSVPADSVVPRLVNFASVAKDDNGKAMKGVIGATFAVYAEPEGGSPLWMETQNINAHANGTFSVQLGATKPDGLPVDLFFAGQARWLGVGYNGGEEQPRVALLSVPYALKAGDAQTLGGLPASAFVLAAPSSSSSSTAVSISASAEADAPPPAGSVTGSGTLDFIPLWTSTSAIGNSVLFQSGSGSTAKLGINTTSPGATLDVKGTTSVEGLLTLPAQGAATASGGKASQPHNWVASSFNSGTSAAVNQTFQWKAEASGNNTATPSGTLNLLFGSGTALPAETGLKLSSKGLFTFATGQTFPGTGTISGVTTTSGSGLSGGGTSGSLSLSLLKTCTTSQTLQWNGTSWVCASSGSGTISGVIAGADLTGGGTSGSVTLNLDTTKIPQLASSNAFTTYQSVSANSSNSILNVTQNATSGPGFGVVGTSYNNNRGQAAVLGQEMATSSGGVFGVEGFIGSLNGAGVYGQDSNPQSSIGNATAVAAGVWGDSGAGTTGVLGTSTNFNSVVGLNSSSASAAIFGENQNTTNSTTAFAPGVFGLSFAPKGMAVVGSGPIHSATFTNYAGQYAFGVVGDGGPGANIGVFGSADAGTGVFGASTSYGIGVYGLSVSGTAIGGASSTGTAIYGLTSNTDTNVPQSGVWGDDLGTAFGNAGVTGTSQSSYGVYADGLIGLYATSESNDGGVEAGLLSAPNGADPLFAEGSNGNFCNVDGNGDLYCTGSTSAAVHLPDSRLVRLYAVQSPENWFEDFGSASLSNGSASITLEPNFRETVTSSQDYHVFLTPRGECEGLYLAGTSASGFEVRELHHGTSNIAFDYRIVVRRKGYEKIRLEDVTEKQNHISARNEMLKRLPHRPAIVLPASSHTRADLQSPVPVQAYQPSQPHKPPLALPVPSVPALTHR